MYQKIYSTQSVTDQLGNENPRVYDKGLKSRRLVLGSLAFVWILSIAVFITSLVFIVARKETLPVKVKDGHKTSTFVSLALVAIATLCHECLGYIHTVALRWALWNDQRLYWNSSLRLLTRAKNSPANHWATNAIYFLVVAITYTAAGQVCQPETSDDESIYAESSYETADVAPFSSFSYVSFLILGCGLLVQAIIVSGSWLSIRGKELSWSSNPLNNALACKQQGQNALRERCMVSYDQCVNTNEDHSAPVMPRNRHGSICKARPFTRYILCYVWLMCVATAVWAVVVRFNAPTDIPRRFVHSFLGSGYEVYFWLNINGLSGAAGNTPQRALLFIIGLCIICAMQLYLTFGLHCIELIVNIGRDEHAWRKASKLKGHGTGTNKSAFSAALSSPNTVILAILKTGIHWIFGQSMQWDALSGQFSIFANALYFLTGFTVILALWVTFMALKPIKGYQPTTYGHIQTTIDLIDDWGNDKEALFWGDKGLSRLGVTIEIRHAGTVSDPTLLNPIQESALYS